MKVKYTGTSDFQVFNKADFDKAGVDQGKLTFAKGEPTEVSDEVGEALTSKEGIFGDFSFEEADDEEADSAPKANAAAKGKNKAASSSGTPQESTGDPATPAGSPTSTTSTAGTAR